MPSEAHGTHALAVVLRHVVRPSQYLGALSTARRGPAFDRTEAELLEYLAGQAVVSIENANLHETVERQAVTDDLTGLANARAFWAILGRELERSRRFGSSLGLVMLDIDDFKQVNDLHGHQRGDEVLAHVAEVLRKLSRDIDTTARYGGEELALILPETDLDGAALLAERVREAIESIHVAGARGGGFLQVTASFEVAAAPQDEADREALVAGADAALYRAKRAGKNRRDDPRGHGGAPDRRAVTLQPASVRFRPMGILDDAIKEHLEGKAPQARSARRGGPAPAGGGARPRSARGCQHRER